TTGNHVWNRREVMDYIRGEPRLLRPINFAEGAPGRGAGMFTSRGGHRVLVINPMGQLFMGPVSDPFAATEKALDGYRLGDNVDAIIVDVHAEATSEKSAIGHF